MEYGYKEAMNDYLDWLIRYYPVNDYVRVKKPSRKEKAKRFFKKAFDALLYAIISVLIAVSMVLVGCVDSILA